MAVHSKIFALTPIGPAQKAARLTTVAALPACTAAGVGVGKTLTGNAVGILTVDGVNVVLNDRVLVKNQVAPADNGIYLCTTAGTAGVAFVLTRATDFDTASAGEITRGVGILVSAGATKAGTTWLLEAGAAITVGTTDLNFVAGNGDTDTVTSRHATAGDITIMENNTVSAVFAIAQTLAPLVGVLRVDVANGSLQQNTNNLLTWRPYAGLSIVGGAALTNGQVPVSGDTSFEFELRDMAFGWLRFAWVGTTGEGTMTADLVAKRS